VWLADDQEPGGRETAASASDRSRLELELGERVVCNREREL
jgi:hypothetical protein